MSNPEIISKLTILQKTLTNSHWGLNELPHDDFFINFVINDVIRISELFPNYDLLDYIKREINASLVSSDSTSYYVEYSHAYARVYVYLTSGRQDVFC